MIGIMHRNGTVYRFADENVAREWLSENIETMEDITVFCDEPAEDSILLANTLYMRQCNGCHSYLKFEMEPHDTAEVVICPKCNGRMRI